jgi:hypothetical protein
LAATLIIRETPEGLTLRVEEDIKVGRILAMLAFSGFFGYMLVHSSDSWVM